MAVWGHNFYKTISN